MIYSSITESNTDARKTSSMFFVCMEAVKNDAWALKYAKERSDDLCLEAVKKDGSALFLIENQTHDIQQYY
jgi:hypothetical protein